MQCLLSQWTGAPAVVRCDVFVSLSHTAWTRTVNTHKLVANTHKLVANTHKQVKLFHPLTSPIYTLPTQTPTPRRMDGHSGWTDGRTTHAPTHLGQCTRHLPPTTIPACTLRSSTLFIVILRASFSLVGLARHRETLGVGAGMASRLVVTWQME